MSILFYLLLIGQKHSKLPARKMSSKALLYWKLIKWLYTNPAKMLKIKMTESTKVKNYWNSAVGDDILHSKRKGSVKTASVFAPHPHFHQSTHLDIAEWNSTSFCLLFFRTHTWAMIAA
jgi:hypothetical protein